MSELTPTYLCNFSHSVHSHETRFSRNNLVNTKCHLCTGQHAFNYKGIMAWSGLSIGTKQSHNLTSFKSNLVKDILAKRMVWFYNFNLHILFLNFHIHFMSCFFSCFCFSFPVLLYSPMCSVNAQFVSCQSLFGNQF